MESSSPQAPEHEAVLEESEKVIGQLTKMQICEMMSFCNPPPRLAESLKMYYALSHGMGFTTDKQFIKKSDHPGEPNRMDHRFLIAKCIQSLQKGYYQNSGEKKRFRVNLEEIAPETIEYVCGTISGNFSTPEQTQKLAMQSRVGHTLLKWSQLVVRAWRICHNTVEN